MPRRLKLSLLLLHLAVLALFRPREVAVNLVRICVEANGEYRADRSDRLKAWVGPGETSRDDG
jgi:hypothetical protein